MKRLLAIILAAAALAASPAAGQTIKSLGYNTTNGEVVYSGTNPLTFTNSLQFATNSRAATRTNLGGTTVGNAVFTATNAAAAASAIGLGTTNTVTFGLLEINSDMQINDASIASLSFGGTFDFEERRLLQGETAIFSYSSNSATVGVPATFATNVTVTGNATLNGVANLAPAQTAASGDSLMTRGLTDARYSFSRWYDANALISLDQTTSTAKTLSTGAGSGSTLSAQMVSVPDVAAKFSLPVDYRIGGQVRVVSYWTDRGVTNGGGTNATIAVFVQPFTAQPTTDSQSNNLTSGTQIQTNFTANYGGSGSARFYVMEQTVNFGTITNISATNPMQIKFVELQRRGGDATDSSTNVIFLSGVHIYAEP